MYSEKVRASEILLTCTELGANAGSHKLQRRKS